MQQKPGTQVHVVKLGGNPLALMPSQISAFKLPRIDGIDAWSNRLN